MMALSSSSFVSDTSFPDSSGSTNSGATSPTLSILYLPVAGSWTTRRRELYLTAWPVIGRPAAQGQKTCGTTIIAAFHAAFRERADRAPPDQHLHRTESCTDIPLIH